MKLAEALKHPSHTLVILIAVEALIRLPHWVQRSTPYAGVWYTPLDADVLSASEGDTALTEVSSLSGCQFADESFYYDHAAGELNINPGGATPYEADAITALFELRAANHGKKEIDDKPWAALLGGTPVYRIKTDPDFGAFPSANTGSVRLDNSGGRFDLLNNRLVTPLRVRALLGVDL